MSNLYYENNLIRATFGDDFCIFGKVRYHESLIDNYFMALPQDSDHLRQVLTSTTEHVGETHGRPTRQNPADIQYELALETYNLECSGREARGLTTMPKPPHRPGRFAKALAAVLG